MAKATPRRVEYDIIEPIGKRVVVRKDDNKRETRSGIVLPDSHEILVITGRVIAISKAIENDTDQTIRQYEQGLLDPAEAIPGDLDRVNNFEGPTFDRFIQIIDTSAGNRVITAIEILSRWNKGPGRLNKVYRRKLKDYARAGVSVVEIDLLRYPPRGRLDVSEDDIPV